MGRQMCARMKELMDRQMFDLIIQASANNMVVARETIKVG